jgi:predicted ATPase
MPRRFEGRTLRSGEVVVRALGSDLRLDYTAVGQSTHLAARMEQVAEPGTVILAPATLALAGDYVTVKPLGPIQIKGLTEPVDVYELTGAAPSRTRLQAAAARRALTRFVGRDVELETLRRAGAKAADGQGQIVAIVGEAGVGKSRLVYEFSRSPALQNWLMLESAAVSYGKATSYSPVVALLKRYFKIDERDDVRAIREKVTGKVLALDRSLEPTLPALMTVLDVPVQDSEWQMLDPAERRQRTVDGIKALWCREASEQPLLLIVEDLHWVDSETQALLDDLVAVLESARVLVAVNYRSEYRHTWGKQPYYTEIRVDPLAAASSEQVLTALLGSDSGLDELKRLLIQRTEGNPFFLEETVRILAETKQLVGTPGAYRVAQSIPAVQIPASVHAVLAARIDRLPSAEKRLLQAASVIGTEVPFALLGDIAEMADTDVHRGLATLVSADLLLEARLFPEREYVFKHVLTHDVTYGTLLQQRRRELHVRVVEAIERLHRDRLAEHVERLADHAVRGELWDKAVDYLRTAAMRAATRSAYADAHALFDEALRALARLPASRERTLQAIV